MKLAGHPLHPAISHFPLALMAMVPLWDILALAQAQPAWWTVGYGCLAAGLAGALVAAMTGAVDFATLPENAAMMRAAIRHLTLVLLATALGVASLIARGGIDPPATDRRILAVALSAVALVPLLVGGWYGGELVFRHGVGVHGPRGEETPDD